ncbi:MAG: hypothetical protein HKN73_17095 [Gemmatimonadetes bacterium]|nr:hypothetical protein [Gemmatimonadota bacterium]
MILKQRILAQVSMIGILTLSGCGDGSGDGPTGPTAGAAVSQTGIVFGDNQVRLPGTPLVQELIAAALDEGGARIQQAGLPASIQVTAGNGTATARSTTTDSGGLIYVTWQLGSLGVQELRISIDGSDPAVFTADAVLAGPLLFASDRASGAGSSTWDLFAMEADGSQVVQLTSGTSRDRDSSWSPDGSVIVFERFDAPENVMQVALADLLPEPFPYQNPDAGSFVWSPDGTRIAFSIKQAGGAGCTRAEHNVWVMGADGSEPTRITDSPCGTANKFPDWAPGGQTLAYESEEGLACCSAAAIWTMTPSGDSRVRVSNDLGYRPHWLPDERRAVMGGWSGEPSASLRIVDTVTGEEESVWTPPSPAEFVLPGGVSPDGRYAVAEVALLDQDSDVFRIDLETGESLNLTNRPDGLDGFPSWGPGQSQP